MKRLHRSMVWMFGLIFCFYAGNSFASGLDIERITKEQLKAKMVDTSVVVVDSRSGRDWKSSEFKIKGAVRQGKDIVKWANGKGYAKDTIMVLYCA